MTDIGERSYVLGQGLRATILTTGEETDGRHDLSNTWQPAGEMTPLHLHTRYEERFWVVSGGLTPEPPWCTAATQRGSTSSWFRSDPVRNT